VAALGLRLRGAGAAVEPRGEADAQQPASGLSGGQVVLPNLSLILDVAAAAFRGPRGPSGAHDPVGNGFTLQQLELHLDAAVDPYLDLQANVVFTLGGVEVEEAYARTLALPLRSQLRAGQLVRCQDIGNRLVPGHR
jgi:hypothetical protein